MVRRRQILLHSAGLSSSTGIKCLLLLLLHNETAVKTVVELVNPINSAVVWEIVVGIEAWRAQEVRITC
jgi:hypothetical protein